MHLLNCCRWGYGSTSESEGIGSNYKDAMAPRFAAAWIVIAGFGGRVWIFYTAADAATLQHVILKVLRWILRMLWNCLDNRRLISKDAMDISFGAAWTISDWFLFFFSFSGDSFSPAMCILFCILVVDSLPTFLLFVILSFGLGWHMIVGLQGCQPCWDAPFSIVMPFLNKTSFCQYRKKKNRSKLKFYFYLYEFAIFFYCIKRWNS